MGKIHIYAHPMKMNSIFSKLVKNKFLQYIFALPLRVGEIIYRATEGFNSSSINVEKLAKFDDEFEPFLAKWIGEQKLVAKRTSEILNWRYVGIPDRGYQIFAARKNGFISGYMVLRDMPMSGFSSLALVDLVTLDGVSTAALLNRCFHIARKKNVDLIATVINPNSALKVNLILKGFIKTPMSFTLVIHRPKHKLEQLDKKSFEDWVINWFDHDYV
jgi:hypothetical protein